MLDLAPIKTLWNPEDLSQPVSIGQAFKHIAELVAEVELLRSREAKLEAVAVAAKEVRDSTYFEREYGSSGAFIISESASAHLDDALEALDQAVTP